MDNNTAIIDAIQKKWDDVIYANKSDLDQLRIDLDTKEHKTGITVTERESFNKKRLCP